MNIQTKKIIAREFLILLIVIGLGIIGFLSIYPYNLYRNKQIEDLSNIINRKQKGIDSLNITIGRNLDTIRDTTQAGLPILKKKSTWEPSIYDAGRVLPPPPPKLLTKSSLIDTDEYGIPIKRKKIPAEKLYENLLKAGYTETNLGTKDEFIGHIENFKDAY